MSVISTFFNYIFSSKKILYREIRKITGFYPGNFSLYETALIHKSASYADSKGKAVNNERLEYLGDAILGAVIADYLYHKFPGADEGFLTQIRSRIVSREKLNELAQLIGLRELIVANTGKYTTQKNMYGDALEAFIGAIYIDQGFVKTGRFIRKHIVKEYIDITEILNTDHNFKSKLIEWGQKHKKEVEFVTRLEDEESKVFLSFIKIDSISYGSGTGISKKDAEQRAAKEAMDRINVGSSQKTE
ncbi:MAG TPA: ribonuclease III [Bacteroidales bacterium]|nr:ribonuclease III [Bacteroidales bacterium]